MGEHGYMDDAINDIEADIFSQWLYYTPKDTSNEKKITDIAILFDLPKEVIESIINDHGKIDQPTFDNFDYLSSLSTAELNGIYKVLARFGKNSIEHNLMSKIENIVNERID